MALTQLHGGSQRARRCGSPSSHWKIYRSCDLYFVREMAGQTTFCIALCHRESQFLNHFPSPRYSPRCDCAKDGLDGSLFACFAPASTQAEDKFERASRHRDTQRTLRWTAQDQPLLQTEPDLPGRPIIEHFQT